MIVSKLYKYLHIKPYEGGFINCQKKPDDFDNHIVHKIILQPLRDSGSYFYAIIFEDNTWAYLDELIVIIDKYELFSFLEKEYGLDTRFNFIKRKRIHADDFVPPGEKRIKN